MVEMDLHIHMYVDMTRCILCTHSICCLLNTFSGYRVYTKMNSKQRHKLRKKNRIACTKLGRRNESKKEKKSMKKRNVLLGVSFFALAFLMQLFPSVFLAICATHSHSHSHLHSKSLFPVQLQQCCAVVIACV